MILRVIFMPNSESLLDHLQFFFKHKHTPSFYLQVSPLIFDKTLHQNEGITAPFRQRLYIKALLKVNTEPLDSPCEKGDV
jgi:hypothetical protein